MNDCKINLAPPEIKKCFKEISIRLQRILYVYEQSLEKEEYDFKSYVYSVMLYISSFNYLFNYDLTNIIINLNILLNNNCIKKQVKKIVLDSKRILFEIEKEWSDSNGKDSKYDK